jgi:hypothetical protein
VGIHRYHRLLLRAVDAVMEPIQDFCAEPFSPVFTEQQPALVGMEDWIRQ